MPGTKLFNPSDALAPRDPQNNETTSAFVVNPPRYAQLGGLSGPSKKGIRKNDMTVRFPGSTIRKIPVS